MVVPNSAASRPATFSSPWLAAVFSTPWAAASSRVSAFARACASYATDPGGSPSTQGSIGLGWTPVHSLELSGEVGIARNGALAMAPLPHHKALDLPLIGGGSGQGSRSTGETTYEPTILLGVRALFP